MKDYPDDDDGWETVYILREEIEQLEKENEQLRAQLAAAERRADVAEQKRHQERTKNSRLHRDVAESMQLLHFAYLAYRDVGGKIGDNYIFSFGEWMQWLPSQSDEMVLGSEIADAAKRMQRMAEDNEMTTDAEQPSGYRVSDSGITSFDTLMVPGSDVAKWMDECAKLQAENEQLRVQLAGASNKPLREVAQDLLNRVCIPGDLQDATNVSIGILMQSNQQFVQRIKQDSADIEQLYAKLFAVPTNHIAMLVELALHSDSEAIQYAGKIIAGWLIEWKEQP